jgi:hypothetical protein
MEKLTQKLLDYLSDKPNYEKFSILHNEMGYDFNFIKELYPEYLKTFEDLKFKKHPNQWMVGAVQATLDFDNGHFVSVVGGGNGLYGDGVNTFEVGFPVLGNSIHVRGWLNPEEVSIMMFEIQMKNPYE